MIDRDQLDASLNTCVTLTNQLAGALNTLQASLTPLIAAATATPPPPIDYTSEEGQVNGMVTTLQALATQLGTMQAAVNAALPPAS